MVDFEAKFGTQQDRERRRGELEELLDKLEARMDAAEATLARSLSRLENEHRSELEALARRLGRGVDAEVKAEMARLEEEHKRKVQDLKDTLGPKINGGCRGLSHVVVVLYVVIK